MNGALLNKHIYNVLIRILDKLFNLKDISHPITMKVLFFLALITFASGQGNDVSRL